MGLDAGEGFSISACSTPENDDKTLCATSFSVPVPSGFIQPTISLNRESLKPTVVLLMISAICFGSRQQAPDDFSPVGRRCPKGG
ncbi:hypothetical protein SAMN06297251_11870 [Fulvimarina manganoxydans]|uniref:Uncharacterized protein n=1 Tax=Fulvimarina manganoxydans TaxID=937218 RepID=A0A1W2DWI7_9HYPH|nr:hypothetical protein SAMN06297251_11870 [Fulvimarina manganoxydans]